MSVPRDFERLLEGYASDRLAPHERRVVEDVLTGGHDEISADEAREALSWEQALAASLSVEAGREDTAALVLERLHSRDSVARSRSAFRADLASSVIAEARESGRLTASRPVRRYYFQRSSVLRAACVFIGIGVLLFVSLRDFSHDDVPQSNRSRLARIAPAIQPVADIAYVADEPSAEQPIPTPSKDDVRDLVGGAWVETSPRQAAIIVLADNQGRFIVKPGSRVRVTREFGRGPRSMRQGNNYRADHAETHVQIELGGIRTDLRQEGRLHVRSAAGFGGSVRGRSEVVVAGTSFGAAQSLLAPDLERSFVVTVGRGSAEFTNMGAETITLAAGEVGIVGEATAIKLARRSPVFGDIPQREWGLRDIVESPDETALELGGQTFTRAFMAREAMRAYGPELVEMLVKSRVAQAELNRTNLVINRATGEIADRFAQQSEALQVAPMRSSAALAERAFQVAAFLTIAGKGSALTAMNDYQREVESCCEQVWLELARDVKLEWPTRTESALGFRIVFRGQTIDVSLAEAWETLARSLRAAEIKGVFDDFTERFVIGAWLEDRGEAWPAARWNPSDDPARRSIQEILVRMSGMTIRQYADRSAVQDVVLSNTPEPAANEVQAFMMENIPLHDQVLLAHLFYPFTDPDQGFAEVGGSLGRELALKRARLACSSLARGELPADLASNKDRSTLWTQKFMSGPRPWWDEIFGSDFRRSVMRLQSEVVSEPIEGREGYHVVIVRRAVQSEATEAERRHAARRLLKIETTRRRIAEILEAITTNRIDPRAMLTP